MKYFAPNLKGRILIIIIISISTSHVQQLPITSLSPEFALKRSFLTINFATSHAACAVVHSCKKHTMPQAIFFSVESCFLHVVATLRSRAIDRGSERYWCVVRSSNFFPASNVEPMANSVAGNHVPTTARWSHGVLVLVLWTPHLGLTLCVHSIARSQETI